MNRARRLLNTELSIGEERIFETYKDDPEKRNAMLRLYPSVHFQCVTLMSRREVARRIAFAAETAYKDAVEENEDVEEATERLREAIRSERNARQKADAKQKELWEIVGERNPFLV